jgi:Spy/CpxP family protein refolding chaperone
MVARRLSLAVLAVAAPLVWMGCQPAVQPPGENQKNPSAAQENGSRKWVRTRAKSDDDAIRVRLLAVEAVQKDLGLTADQIAKIRDCVKTAGEMNREFAAKWHEILPPDGPFPREESEAREKKFRAFAEDWKRKGKELQTKLLAMLTPSQIDRLKQIQLQTAIAAALARPEIVKALDISQEQLGKIRALRDRLDEKLMARMPNLRGLNPKERRQKMIEFMKESDKAGVEAKEPILDVLTPEQRAKFDKVQGKKIEVKWAYETLIPEDAEF